MNKKVLTFEVEATYGTDLKPGQRVKKGQVLGISLDFKQEIRAPLNGIVRSVEFNPEHHSFTIEISPKAPRRLKSSLKE